MPPEDPIRLIQGIVNKDRGAFGRFYDQYASLVFGMALRILRNTADAEETVQDVFYQIWQKAGSYEKRRGKPESWIISITRSRAIDRLRSVQRKRRGAQSLDEHPETQDKILAKHFVKDASLDALSTERLLEQVTSVQREVLELAYFEGLTQSEIAVRLDVPLGTIKTRMRDGLKKLREILEKKEKVR